MTTSTPQRRPKFEAGQDVAIAPSKLNIRLPARGRIVRALPLSSGPIQYRVKSEGETFERVIDEGRMASVSDESRMAS